MTHGMQLKVLVNKLAIIDSTIRMGIHWLVKETASFTNIQELFSFCAVEGIGDI